jgi:hypothetical protein
MKKLAVLTLTGLVLAGAALTFSMAPDVNDQAQCNRNHLLCREYALDHDAPWYKVMILLTTCDIAFGKCSLGF